MNRKSLLGDPPPIRISSRDLGRIDTLLAHISRPTVTTEFLQREIDRAAVSDGPPASFVGLGTRVTFEDDGGSRYTTTLVPPAEVPSRPDAISILTPVGAALLGLSEGQSIAYRTLDGRTKSVRIVRIHPAAG